MADDALTDVMDAPRGRMAPPQRSALFSIAAAVFLVALKLVTGLLTGSLAMIAEAAHSGTDLVAALLTFYALRVAIRPADRDHPYGHGKAEHLAALAEGAFLLVVSAVIVFESISRLTGNRTSEVDAAWWAFLVLGVVLVVDISRAVVSFRASRRYNSAALAANAVHFASDFGGTLAVVIGLALVQRGVRVRGRLGRVVRGRPRDPCGGPADAPERAGADGPGAVGCGRTRACGDRRGRAAG